VKVPNNAFASSFVLKSCEDVQFLKNIVTGDESWIYRYDPETKQQLPVEGSLISATKEGVGHQVRNKTKVMLLAFFDYEVIVHHQYAPNRQTINKAFYLEVLRRLRKSVHRN
jgi:hypothetical protein